MFGALCAVINEEQIPTYMAAAGDLKVGLELTRLAIKNGIRLEWREENASALVNQEEC